LVDQVEAVLQRQAQLNLVNLGQILDSLGLRVMLTRVPVERLGRVSTPAVLMQNGHIGVLDGVDPDGQARLLENLDHMARVHEIQALFERLEAQETTLRLLEMAQQGEGVKIFIGAENGVFSSAGLSMVVAPFKNAQQKIVGAIGVIGPTRINYGRVIPVVDYTARVLGRLLG
jgi:hypothetical protein